MSVVQGTVSESVVNRLHISSKRCKMHAMVTSITIRNVPDETRDSAEKATGIAKDTADRAINAEKAVRGLMAPKPENAPATNGGPGQAGYGQSERNEMQRLIESKQ